MADKDVLIDIDSINFNFPGNGAPPLEVLKNLSLDIRRGEFVAIVGPSGCGKTSLLKLVGDLLQPTNGTILIDGHTPREARRNREFSFVFQNPVLLPWRTVRKNVELAGEIFHDSQVRARAQEFIKLVGLTEFADASPHQLSGGMQSRVAIARALTLDPSVLLMDEPFGDLDELTRDKMNDELLRIWSQTQSSVLFVTHSIPEAVFLSDRVIIFSERPASIKKIVLIPFERPRKQSLRESIEFIKIVSEIRRALEPEVIESNVQEAVKNSVLSCNFAVI